MNAIRESKPQTSDIDASTAASVSAGGEVTESNAISGGRIFGYARVSTGHQDHRLQIDALTAAGVAPVFITTETVSGAADRLPLRDGLLGGLRAGDTLTVYRLDRLGRRTLDVLAIVEDLAARGVRLRSLTEAIDTATPAGRLMVTVLAAVAAMERDLIRERVQAGVDAARRRGRVGGRPPRLDAAGVQAVGDLQAAGRTVAETAAALGVSPRTVARVRARLRDESAAAAA